MDGWRSTIDAVEADEGINLEVGEVEVNVNGVETDEEVDEDFLLLLRYMFKKGLSPDVTRGERTVNANVESKGFGIDITNIDTTFMGEEDGIALAIGVYAYIKLGVGRVREEWL